MHASKSHILDLENAFVSHYIVIMQSLPSDKAKAYIFSTCKFLEYSLKKYIDECPVTLYVNLVLLKRAVK